MSSLTLHIAYFLKVISKRLLFHLHYTLCYRKRVSKVSNIGETFHPSLESRRDFLFRDYLKLYLLPFDAKTLAIFYRLPAEAGQ